MDLTKQEREVVLFLVVVALVGLGVNFVSKRYSKIRIIGYLNQDIGKINLNQAGQGVLVDVPGIGKVLAGRIIEYRRQHSKFKDIAELRKIKGIGKSKYESIRDYFILD